MQGVITCCNKYCLLRLVRTIYGYALRKLKGSSVLLTLQVPISTYKFSNLSPYISVKNELRGFDKRSRYFLFGDNFINSYNLIS